MKRAVIAGATGVVGTALTERLLQEKIEVLILARKDSKRLKVIPVHPLVTVIHAGMEDYAELKNTTDRCWDVFYNLAWGGTFGEARNDTEIQIKNISYMLDAVKLAKRLGCHTFVGVGSQAEYGRYEGKLNAGIPAFPENGYGMAKLCAGQMSRLLCRELGMRHIWARILSVYGPGDGEKTMVMSALNSFFQGKAPEFTAGEQQWDYLYNKDAARALYLMGEKGIDGRVYCLGSGRVKPLRDYIVQIRDAVLETERKSLSDVSNQETVEKAEKLLSGIGKLPYTPNQVMYLCADIAQLTEDTGFEPEYSFAEGISETAEWMKKGYLRKQP